MIIHDQNRIKIVDSNNNTYDDNNGNHKFCVITVKSQWAQLRLKLPASQLFAQPYVHAQIKENIKAPRHWTLWED